MLTAAGQWVFKHWRGLAVTILLPLALGLVAAVVYDMYKDWRRERPFVKISAEAYEVPVGKQVKVWAETFPTHVRPGRYDWSPENRILNNGQQLVLLNTETDERRTESYQIEVRLTPVDNNGSPLPEPSPIFIKVVPQSQWNNKPKIIMPIRTNPKIQEVRAGESVTLEALATDEDKEDRDKLYYDWHVENEAGQVEKNGEPRVKINTPADLVRYSSVPLRVKLTVKDGHEGGVDFGEATLTVVPKPKERPRKAGPPKYIVIVRQSPAQPQSPNSGGSQAAPAAPPEQPPAKQSPAETKADPPSNTLPAKPQQPKADAQKEAP